ncbi:ComEC/Rec2 family competence protein [Mycolicibacterium poriferae]|uniref:ComEC/Rec2 family competence protein n=1 Tax=Mycolicibacterium poriferae TaxID=39694 RepID=UPI0024BAF7A5|nr:ComEC/Rec2 family competence protein [Mycolicibacterium poriferae]
MTLVDLRLVPAALTSWAVTASGICWSWRGALIAAAAAVGVTATTGWWAGCRDRRRKPDLRAVAAGAAAVALVGFGFAVAVGLRADHVRTHPVAQYFGRSTTVIVAPTETPRILTGGRVMFRATLLQLDGARSGGRVVVFASGSGYADLVVGQPAAFRTGVSHPTRRDLTVAVLAARGPPTRGQPAPVHQVAHRVRAAFAQAARLVLDTDQAAVLPALVLGDTSAVPAPVTAQFRVAGLTHLTAVSGANVTIVCGAVLLSAALVGPRIAVLLAAVALLGFVVVVQPSASVLRAAVMAAITLLAVVTRRRRQVLPALAATVVGLMVAAPELAVDAGFALSVSATAALVVLAPVWSRRLSGRGWPRPLADAVSVALSAQLVTAPLVAGLSGSVSLVGVTANLLVAPVIPPITVIGTAASALCPLWPAGAQLLIRCTEPPVWWLLNVARYAADMPAAAVPVPSGVPGVVTVAIAVAGVAATWHWAVSPRRDTIVR